MAKVTTKGLKEANAAIAARVRLISPGSPVFGEIGNLVARDIKSGIFPSEGDPPWPKSGRAKKEGGKTLQDTGRLRNSINYSVAGRKVTIGTNVVYGPPQHFGWPIKNIPARPFMMVRPKVAESVIGRLGRAVVEGK